jgi:hypothetical protein
MATTGKLYSVTGNGTVGTNAVKFAPLARPVSTVLPTPAVGDFAANIGAKSGIVVIIFEQPIDYVQITAKNSTVPGNKIVVFNKDGKQIGEAEFDFGQIFSLLGVTSTNQNPVSTKRLEISGIRRIELHPAAAEGLIFYGGLTIRNENEIISTMTGATPANLVSIPLQLKLIAKPASQNTSINVFLSVLPPAPVITRIPNTTPTHIDIRPLPIDMAMAIENIAQHLTAGKIAGYFDPDRELKTVLNFGNDFQSLLTNWQRDATNLAEGGILVKLYRPLPVNIGTKSLVWISRELSPTWVDNAVVIITPERQIVYFLRPPNRSTQTVQLFGRELSNVTLNDLLPSGSLQISGSNEITLEDPTLRQFFGTDVAGVELNVDYTDYTKFVHFSSAAARLTAFREKLIQIEALNSNIALQNMSVIAAISSSGGLIHVSSSAVYTSTQDLLAQREALIRGFDGYERFLYFASGTFSGSLSGLPEDPIIVISNVSWPTASAGIPASVTSSASVTYYTTQLGYAQEYDALNATSLVNNIPLYLKRDDKSVDFLTFLNMVGHFFDMLKLYIDNMTTIYDRDPSPDRGLAKELMWHVAQSLGIELPNQYAIKELLEFGVGQATLTQKTYKQAIAETWKRFIHNHILIAKSKGTITSLYALLNIYGIPPELMRVRESATPSPLFTTGSFELFNELTRTVLFNTTASVTVPFVASTFISASTPTTIELRFAMTTTGSFVSTALLSSSPSWSLILEPTGSAENHRGHISLLDGLGAYIATSDIAKFYNGDFYSIMLRQDTSTSAIALEIRQFDDDVFEYVYNTSVTQSVTASFRSDSVVIGTANSTASNDMLVDEFRLWRESITDETFRFHAEFPGMYAGNEGDSANENLLVRHSFGIPQNLFISASMPNETPFINSGSAYPSALTASVAAGFYNISTFPHQYKRTTRQTKRFTPGAGGSQFSSAKITIAPSSSFRSDALAITGSSAFPVLSRTKSAVRTNIDRKNATKGDNRVGLYLTLAESINDSILRSLGNFDLNDLIGDPRNLYSDEYSDLIALNTFYKSNYAPTFDQNGFIRSVEGLLDAFFDHARKIVPISTKLITGIVVEPTILERNRVRLVRPLNLEGAGTRRERNAYTILQQSGSLPSARNVDARIDRSLSGSWSATMTQLTALVGQQFAESATADTTPLAVVVQQTTQSLIAGVSQLTARINQNDILALAGAELTELALVTIDDTRTFEALMNVLNPTIDCNIIFTLPSASIGGDFMVPEIKSQNDLDDPRNATFFTHISGSFALTGYKRVRLRQGILVDKGAWVYGTAYVEHDMVTVSGSEFRCLTSTILTAAGTVAGFVSYITPDKDQRNWVPVSARIVAIPVLFMAVVSGSSYSGPGGIALVPFATGVSTAATPFVGYSSNHYKFFRPTYTAYIRSRFSGVKNTQDTTIDGKPPIEITLSSDAQLFVKDGTPRQTVTDESGPILEVRPNTPNA